MFKTFKNLIQLISGITTLTIITTVGFGSIVPVHQCQRSFYH